MILKPLGKHTGGVDTIPLSCILIFLERVLEFVMAFKNSFDIDLLEMQVSFKLMHACLIANKFTIACISRVIQARALSKSTSFKHI